VLFCIYLFDGLKDTPVHFSIKQEHRYRQNAPRRNNFAHQAYVPARKYEITQTLSANSISIASVFFFFFLFFSFFYPDAAKTVSRNDKSKPRNNLRNFIRSAESARRSSRRHRANPNSGGRNSLDGAISYDFFQPIAILARACAARPPKINNTIEFRSRFLISRPSFLPLVRQLLSRRCLAAPPPPLAQ